MGLAEYLTPLCTALKRRPRELLVASERVTRMGLLNPSSPFGRTDVSNQVKRNRINKKIIINKIKLNKNKKNKKPKKAIIVSQRPIARRSITQTNMLELSKKGLSVCAAKYAKALSDPWSPDADGACIPKAPSRASQKIKLFSRFVVAGPQTTTAAQTYVPIFFTPCLSKDSPVAIVGPPLTPAELTTFTISPAMFSTAVTVTNGTTVNTTSGLSTITLVGNSTVVLGPGSQIVVTGAGFPASTKIVSLLSGTANTAGAVYAMSGAAATTVSGAAFTVTNVDSTNSVLANKSCSAYYVNSPYSSSQFNDTISNQPQVQGRIVSFGASTQYIGTVFNKGGLYYQYTSPNHSNLNTLTNGTAYISTLGTQDETFIERITEKKEWFVTGSTETSEIDYSGPYNLDNNGTALATNAVYSYSAGYSLSPDFASAVTASLLGANFSASIGGSPMVLLVSVPQGALFEIEVCQHVEFIGPLTAAFHTPTHSDARGFEVVNTAVQRLAQLRVSNPNDKLPSLMSKALMVVLEELAPVVMPMARAGVQSMAMMAMNGVGRALSKMKM